MKRISLLLVASLGFGSAAMAAPDAKKPAPAKAPAGKKAPPEKKPAPKKIVPVSAEKKKVLAELYGGFKFGMTKDDVLKVLQKQIDERFEEKIKSTEDITKKDKLRSEKKRELTDVTKSYVEFNGKNVGGWDVSIIEGEFAHKTNEAMLDRWENKDGKNQRRFFFFADGNNHLLCFGEKCFTFCLRKLFRITDDHPRRRFYLPSLLHREIGFDITNV